ncbi:MAG: lytic transglycosylase domain-containing protein [Synergistales bacterium]|nr:lytic transglycosylase domain-containing protein [Synergistales bacterium]
MKKSPPALALSILLVLILASSGLSQSHVEKAKALDEYIRNQYRSSNPIARKAEPRPDENLKRAIALGFRKFNKEVSMIVGMEYAGYIIESCDQLGVHDPALIAAMIVKESTVRPGARSRYAYGLMQVNWNVHKKSIARRFPWIRTLNDLLVPRNNILVGTWIFSNYLKDNGGDVDKALHRYLGRTGSRYVRQIKGYRGTFKREIQSI